VGGVARTQGDETVGRGHKHASTTVMRKDPKPALDRYVLAAVMRNAGGTVPPFPRERLRLNGWG
jgi:hypothetical protein